MSALVKSGRVGALKLRPVLSDGVEAPARKERDLRDQEIDRLVSEVARLKELCGNLQRENAARLKEAHDAGVREGLAQASDREEARVAALLEGVRRAEAQFATQLASLEMLAPELARSALAKLFADTRDWGPMVAAAIEREIACLGAEAIVSVAVSPLDFDELPQFDGVTSVDVDARLAPGNASFALRMGRADIDLPSQWQQLSAILAEMTGQGAT